MFTLSTLTNVPDVPLYTDNTLFVILIVPPCCAHLLVSSCVPSKSSKKIKVASPSLASSVREGSIEM